LLM
jgi:hypothetical protein